MIRNFVFSLLSTELTYIFYLSFQNEIYYIIYYGFISRIKFVSKFVTVFLIFAYLIAMYIEKLNCSVSR